MEIHNWYCEYCKRWIASSDIMCGVHVDCRSKAIWKKCVADLTFKEDKENNNGGRELPSVQRTC